MADAALQHHRAERAEHAEAERERDDDIGGDRVEGQRVQEGAGVLGLVGLGDPLAHVAQRLLDLRLESLARGGGAAGDRVVGEVLQAHVLEAQVLVERGDPQGGGGDRARTAQHRGDQPAQPQRTALMAGAAVVREDRHHRGGQHRRAQRQQHHDQALGGEHGHAQQHAHAGGGGGQGHKVRAERAAATEHAGAAQVGAARVRGVGGLELVLVGAHQQRRGGGGGLERRRGDPDRERGDRGTGGQGDQRRTGGGLQEPHDDHDRQQRDREGEPVDHLPAVVGQLRALLQDSRAPDPAAR